ncbi:hypothetical protein HKD37_03G008337 [Glycine soja]
MTDGGRYRAYLVFERPFSEEFMKFCLERFEVDLCFFTELNKVWENVKKGGPYSASNALLIDDKPYMAFLNPLIITLKCRIIQPYSFSHLKCQLCSYLKGVAQWRGVKPYVKDHLFGIPAVSSFHPDWNLYPVVKERT